MTMMLVLWKTLAVLCSVIATCTMCTAQLNATGCWGEQMEYSHHYPELVGTPLELFQDLFVTREELCHEGGIVEPRDPTRTYPDVLQPVRPRFMPRRVGRSPPCTEEESPIKAHTSCTTCMDYFAPYTPIGVFYPVHLKWIPPRGAYQMIHQGRCSDNSNGETVRTWHSILVSKPKINNANDLRDANLRLKLEYYHYPGFCAC